MFEEPVTESIAPGYHDMISMPMDYSTVESRLEKKHYTSRAEVSVGVGVGVWVLVWVWVWVCGCRCGWVLVWVGVGVGGCWCGWVGLWVCMCIYLPPSLPPSLPQFETDVRLIFTNCMEYNGDDSEYSELANQMLEEFKKLCKVHLDGGDVKVTIRCIAY